MSNSGWGSPPGGPGQPPPYQPPGPPAPPGPPYGPGRYPPPPRRPNNDNKWIGLAIGALIGTVLGTIGPLLTLFISDVQRLEGAPLFAAVVLVPTALPVPLLLFKPTRWWGIGMMVGTAVTAIVVAGLCVLIISGYSA